MDFLTFFSLAEEFNVLNQVVYKAYITRVGDDLKTNPKKFWNLINSKRKSNQLPKCMFFEKSASNDAGKSNLFADFFQSVYVQPDLSYQRMIVLFH